MPNPGPLDKTHTNHQDTRGNQGRIPGTNPKALKPCRPKIEWEHRFFNLVEANGRASWCRGAGPQHAVFCEKRFIGAWELDKAPIIRHSGEEGVENSPKVRTSKH